MEVLPAKHRGCAESPGAIDRLAYEQLHQDDGTVRLGLL